MRCVLLISLLFFGCGQAADAPGPTNAPAPAQCPPMVELAPTAFELMETGQLPTLKFVLNDTLSDAQISALLDGLIRTVRALSVDELQTLLALGDDPRLNELLPLVTHILSYLAGDPNDPGSFKVDVLTDTSRLLRTCDGSTLFDGFSAILSAPEVGPLLSQLGEIISLPIVADLLSSDLQGALNRDGFATLVCNILAALIEPGFDFQTDVIQALSGIDLLPIGEPPISDFLQTLAVLLSPERSILPALSDVICCDLYDVPRCIDVSPSALPLPRKPVFTWAVYDLFIQTQIDFNALLQLAGELVDDPKIKAAITPLITVLRQLGDDADLRAALVDTFTALLEPEIAQGLLPEVILLLDSGATNELLTIVEALGEGCAL